MPLQATDSFVDRSGTKMDYSGKLLGGETGIVLKRSEKRNINRVEGLGENVLASH